MLSETQIKKALVRLNEILSGANESGTLLIVGGAARHRFFLPEKIFKIILKSSKSIHMPFKSQFKYFL